MPSRPKGTLTRKMSRHPLMASKNPPTDGPRARPIAWAAPWMPMALPSDRLGTASTMMATLLAWRSAAPTAWRARNPIRAPEARGQAAQGRADDEDPEAVDVEELAAPHVGEAPDRGHRRHQDQEVAQAHPGDRAHAGVERPLQRGQGDRHDAGIELTHEGPDADRRHGQPVGVGSVSDDGRSPGFHHQPMPSDRLQLLGRWSLHPAS